IFADRGGTVLLSSHLLHEIQIIADEIIVIGRGKIVAHGPKEELLKGAGTYVRAIDGAALADALQEAGIAPTPQGDGFHVDATPEEAAKAAADKGVVLIEIRESSQGGLEEMFLELTSETQRDSLPRYGGNS
ncbi:MAG TPA: ABC transporter ATP-binding protein, partial [Aeromicrobium sp.]|nr:ABC transporter ATP-binding protein [Aeromicrobium sp.]